MLNTGKKCWLGRSLLALVLAVALVLPLIPVSFAEAVTYEVSDYKQGEDPAAWTYPTEEGKVFAGWYEDADFITPYADVTGTAYAKFVDADLITVKRQFNIAASQKSSNVDVRFITALDSLNYHNVIFNVEIPSQDKSWTWTEKTAYSSLEADGKTQTAAEVFTSAEYLVVHSLSNIPNAVFGENFEVTISWTTLDGTVVTGETAVFTLNSLLAESVQISLENFNSETIGDDTVGSVGGNYSTVTATVSDDGIDGSNAVSYSITTANKTNSQNFDLTFDSIDVSASDILWFWLDSDMVSTRMLHVQIGASTLSFLAPEYIHTIADVNGSAAIQTVNFTEETATGDTLALIDSNGKGAAAGSYARIRIPAGWYGWIGIPVGNLDGNSSSVPATLSKIRFRTAIVTADNASFETMHIDELWLTSADTMPNLTNAQLLYNGDYVAPADPEPDAPVSFMNPTTAMDATTFEGYTTLLAETASGSVTAVDQSVSIVEGKGYDGDNALSVAVNTAGYSYTGWMEFTLTDANAATVLGLGTTTGFDTDSMLWFYVDSDFSQNIRIEVRLNDSVYSTKGTKFYTLTSDGNGWTMTEKSMLVNSTNSTDTNTGTAAVAGATARKTVLIEQGYEGWIGIPLANYFNTETVDITAIDFHIRNNGDRVGFVVGDTVYLGNFCIAAKNGDSWVYPVS